MKRPTISGRRVVEGVCWFILFLSGIYLFLPVDRINAQISRTLAAQGLSLSPAARKTFFPGLAWDRPRLSSGQGELVAFSRLKVRPLPSRLVAGRVSVGSMAEQEQGGRLETEWSVGKGQTVELRASDLQLGQIPFFGTVLGGAVSGILQGNGHAEQGAKGWNGELKVAIDRLDFSGLRMGGFTLPAAAGLQSRGMVRIADGKGRLESFTLQGDGIYMRLSGAFPVGANMIEAPLNLILEIMPKPDFLERQKLIFLLLAKFMTSPGVYRIPISGTLLKPQII